MEHAYLKGIRVSAFDCTERYSELKRKGKELYKCKLGNELILRKGKKKIPHFAHKSDCVCEKWGEGETYAHYYMKIYLQQLLSISDEFNEYDGIAGVRPDLLWNMKYAIEIQHSPIKIDEYKRRNKIYKENNLIPLWIFHKKETTSFEEKKLNGIYGKIHKIDDSIYRLLDIEQHIYDQEESLLYYYFPDEIIFNINKSKLKPYFSKKNPGDPKLESFMFHWENDFTLFKLILTQDINNPELLKFHADHRYHKKLRTYIKRDEFLAFISIRNKCTNPKNLLIEVYDNHITSFEISSEQSEIYLNQIGVFKDLENLSLDSTNLKIFPEILQIFSKLEDLNLSYNQITEINGNVIECLSNLQTFNINNNKIETLPQSIGSLSNLKILSFNNNEITCNFPEEVRQSLHRLNANGCKIIRNDDPIPREEYDTIIELGKIIKRKIPKVHQNEAEFGYCTKNGHIEEVMLFGRNLKIIPECIKRLKFLRYFELGDNNITVIPDWIGNLKFLEFIILTNNLIKSIPETFFRLSKLKSFNFGNNNLTLIPDSIGDLNLSGEMDLSGNNIESLPESIENLQNLSILNLSTNHLKKFPDFLKNFSSLKELDLIGNIFTELPFKVLDEFINRKIILKIEEKYKKENLSYFESNNLRLIEEELGFELKDISNSDIFSKKLNGYYPFGNQVKILTLNNTEIESFPESIYRLESLTCLSIVNNNLKKLPPKLFEMKNLRELYFHENLVDDLPDSFFTDQIQLQKISFYENSFEEDFITKIQEKLKEVDCTIVKRSRDNYEEEKVKDNSSIEDLSINFENNNKTKLRMCAYCINYIPKSQQSKEKYSFWFCKLKNKDLSQEEFLEGCKDFKENR